MQRDAPGTVEMIVVEETAAGLEKRACQTQSLPLHDPNLDEPDEAMRGQSAFSEPLHPNLSAYSMHDVIQAARCEMARTVEDVLARRTRALLLNARASCEVAPRVASIMARELGRDAQWEREQVMRFRRLADGYIA